jgi:hypothetical protein
MKKRLVIVLLCLAMSACSSEEVRDLGHGYTLEATDPDNHTIAHNNTIVVLPNVVDCTKHEEYVVCLRSRPVGLTDPRFFDAPFGWLVLNTRSGELVQGLDRNALQALLKKKNISFD